MTAEPTLRLDAAAAARLRRMGVDLGRSALVAVVGLLAAAALLVVWRRLAGALNNSLPSPALLGVGLLLIAVTAAVRTGWQRLSGGLSAPRLDWPMAVLPTVSLLLMGAALSLPRGADVGLLGFWMLVAAEEAWVWRPVARRRLHRRLPAEPPKRTRREEPSPLPAPHFPPAESAAAVPDGDVLQQLTRSRAADGSEQLSGWLRMPFLQGQRTGSVHVAFCPPFPTAPALTTEQLDGPATRIKTAQLLPHGVRLDFKLAATAEQPDSVLLRFSARSEAEK